MKFIITVALMTCFCAQKPAPNARDMMLTKMTKVLFSYGGIKPLVVAVLDEGAIVKALPTKNGWYRIWWFEKGKWKNGYVEDFCLRDVPVGYDK